LAGSGNFNTHRLGNYKWLTKVTNKVKNLAINEKILLTSPSILKTNYFRREGGGL